MRHPDWGLTDTWKTPMSDVIIPPMVFGVITQDEIVSEVENEVLSLSQKEMHIARLDYTKEYDEEMARLIMQQEEYKYPYQEECNLPMKASVSDIKHRHAVEEDAVSVLEDWKQTDRPTYIPSFIESREERQFTGADRGTLYHAVMQYIRFENIHTEEDVDNELNRLISIGVFSKEAYEANIINKKRILRCCESPVLTRMGLARERRELYLEQPFVMGVKANEVYTGITSEETVLIQGIIDVYFEEDGEMVLVDYKTDRLEPGDDKKLVDRYRIQMECYKQAIEKASGKLVKEMILY